MDLISNPYRGPAHIPHISEDYFRVIFYSSNLAFAMLGLPGRFFGTEARPRRYNRDYIMRVAEERAIMRQVRRGEQPTFAYRRPIDTIHSWPRRWHRHLLWKRWTLERTGPIYSTT